MNTKVKIGKGATLVTAEELKYLEFDCFKKYENRLLHFFSTRIGGVSTGECNTLNLGFNRNDSVENVKENYLRLCKAVGIEPHSLVMANQVHETLVRTVNEKDRGKGFLKESDIRGVDGLLTQTPGVTMVTFHADCVPVYLYETGINAAALLHSGWRGTLKNITSQAVDEMSELRGFRTKNLVAAIGPSIRLCCFEVGEEVYKLFWEKYPKHEFYRPMSNGKWKIDLQGIIKAVLKQKGLLEENIHDSEICTKCRKDLFYSYRGDLGMTGSLAAFMQLK